MTIKEVNPETDAGALSGEGLLNMETRQAMQVEHNYNTIPEDMYQVDKIYNSSTKRFKKYYRCTFGDCSYVFDQFWNLKNHYRTHTKERPFQCRICEKRYGQMSIMVKHLISVHKMQPYLEGKDRVSKQKVMDKRP